MKYINCLLVKGKLFVREEIEKEKNVAQSKKHKRIGQSKCIIKETF